MTDKKEMHDLWNNEVSDIINYRIQFIQRNYPQIRDSYQKEYGFPELDPIRHEIALCIIFGFYQAAITLTNHLHESMLKYALLIIEGRKKQQSKEEITNRSITAMAEKYKEAYEKINEKNLGDTINMATKRGLIEKDEQKKLHEFREIYRNAYSHADKQKTFGKSSMSNASCKD